MAQGMNRGGLLLDAVDAEPWAVLGHGWDEGEVGAWLVGRAIWIYTGSHGGDPTMGCWSYAAGCRRNAAVLSWCSPWRCVCRHSEEEVAWVRVAAKEKAEGWQGYVAWGVAEVGGRGVKG